MMKTRMLYVGDLVLTIYGNTSVIGMITDFDDAFRSYKIEWLNVKLTNTHASWITVQEYRNNYLVFRENME